MKTSVLLVCGLLFIILNISVQAACPEPDISTYNTCTSGCPDAVKYTEKFATCINTCLSSWTKTQDAYRACQKTEADQKALDEQKLLEEQNKTKVSNIRGNVSITKADGTRKSISKDTILKDGDKLETNPGGSVTLEMPDADHTITLDQKTSVVYSNKKSISVVELLFGRLRIKFLQHILQPGESIVGGGIHSQIIIPGKGAGADRGTDFIAEHYGNVGRFYVQEGIVDVTNNNNETFEVDAWEMITVYSNGTTFKSELSATNWYGLLNSIEVGVDFTPKFETTNPGEQKISDGTQQRASLPIVPVIIVILIGLLIILGAFKIKKKKK